MGAGGSTVDSGYNEQNGQNVAFENMLLQGMGSVATGFGQALNQQATAVASNATGMPQQQAELANQFFTSASRIATTFGQALNEESRSFGTSASNSDNPLERIGRMASAMETIVQRTDVQEAMEEMSNAFGLAGGVWQPSRPPTSDSTIQGLPLITITAHDIENNHSTDCVICLEKFVIGEKAVRLPCGHIFHEDCIKVWLKSSNTCPICRFELPTDDAAYEEGRRARMEGRRPRLRVSDLMARSPHELRYLAEHLGVNINGCVEKDEVVQSIATSGCIEVIPEPATETPPFQPAQRSQPASQAMTLAEVYSMSIREIKAYMIRSGIDTTGCLEKDDLVQKLLDAGLISDVN